MKENIIIAMLLILMGMFAVIIYRTPTVEGIALLLDSYEAEIIE